MMQCTVCNDVCGQSGYLTFKGFRGGYCDEDCLEQAKSRPDKYMKKEAYDELLKAEQQSDLIESRAEQVSEELAENKKIYDEFAQSDDGIKKEETFKDMVEYGFSPAEILNFLDAIMGGKMRHISIDWLGGKS